jgi:hypothetical protein
MDRRHGAQSSPPRAAKEMPQAAATATIPSQWNKAIWIMSTETDIIPQNCHSFPQIVTL